MTMKRLTIIILILSIFGLAACNEYQRDGMVSDRKGMFSLYAVGDEEIDVKLDKESDINNVFRISSETDYDKAARDTPYLEYSKDKPNYFLFDTKDLVYQTTSYDKLVEYLKDHPTPK